MATEKMEWVEIIEPKTKEHMYANLTTGECVWDPPVGVNVKKTDNKQWWELFDHNTGRFYYYNATSQKTVWHRPQNCDIIPLAKLQTLKQNTEPPNNDDNDLSSTGSRKSKESVATQTPGRSIRHPPPSNIKLNATVCSHSSDRRVCNYKRMAMDSGRSSDSSSVSLCKHPDQQALSLASHQIVPQQAQPQTPAQAKPSLAPSPSTPLLKKRSPSQTKANSFDINISIGGGYSLGQENRSSCRTQRILTGSVSNHGISRSQSFAQKQSAPPEEEEDSMHEKYFMSGRRSADSPVRVMDKEAVLKNMSFSKLSPDYSNLPPTKVNQETSTRHVREPSSDLEESNGLTPAGAWGNSLKKHNDNSENALSLDSKRLQLNQLGQSIDHVEKNKNIEAWCSGVQVEPHILTLHHYIMEQAKLSGCYRFGEVPEEGDSLNSDDDDLHPGANMDYESDEFADDEAVSNQDDSSSQEFIPDDPPTPPHTYMNAPRYEPPHYSDAADYADALSVVDHNSSLYCNTRVSQHTVRPIQPSGVPPLLETQHTSLKRNRDPPQTQPPLYSPILERSELQNFSSAHSLPNTPTQLSATLQYEQLSRLMMNRGDRKLPSDSDIEKYAQDNLNIHKKGIFRKKYSVRELLSWSKDPIRKPMLVLSDKNLKKEATEIFKMVQIYMGDRKPKPGSSQEAVLLDMCNLGHSKAALRDELFIQICRQTTENPRKESLRRGWELMTVCLYFFPPSPKFQSYLEGYMNRHRDPSYDFPEVGKWPIHVQVSHYASVACKRLQRIGVGGKRPIRKPTPEEIEQARIQIFRPSMFGSTLEEVMSLQKSRFPHYKLPWVQTTLSDEVLRLQGTHTEGIFRVSADVDEVTSLKQQLDRWERPSEYTDAHTPASLLKLWYRELYEPLIPDNMYEDCIQCHDDADRAAAIVENLPHYNKLVLAYLIRFLQIFAQPDVVAVTKMDASNLAMVMAPNCLRCSCQEPRVMYENARKEMAFIRTLILSMDTAFMQGVL